MTPESVIAETRESVRMPTAVETAEPRPAATSGRVAKGLRRLDRAGAPGTPPEDAPPLGFLGDDRGARGDRALVMGVRFTDVSEADAVRIVVDAADVAQGHWTVTANLDHVRRYHSEARARALIDDADMVVADGTPLIWASRLAGSPLGGRVAGSDMIWSICEAASERRLPVYLLGGEPGVAPRAAAVLMDAYPGLEIAGTACPPMGFEHDELELELIERRLRAAAPRIVLVALGFPKQDVLIDRLRSSLPGASFIGVGISLSFVAGEVARAPAWTQRLGLEWLYRLAKEPRRLTRRYLVHGIPFALRLFISAARHRLFAGGGWGAEDGSVYGVAHVGAGGELRAAPEQPVSQRGAAIRASAAFPRGHG